MTTAMSLPTAMLPTQPAELRRIIRAGEYGGVTSGLANGHVQANLAVLPRDLAFDFLLFCQRNPQPCPLLEVIEAGSVEPSFTAPGADISTDVPAYRIYENGEMTAELASVADVWREDLVSFLLGCSFSFEAAMADCGIPLRHQEAGSNVPMYITNIPTRPAGMFSGPMVVSMRPIPQEQIVRAVQVTSRFPDTHGAPVHIGDPGRHRHPRSSTPPSSATPSRSGRAKPRCSGPAASLRRPSRSTASLP